MQSRVPLGPGKFHVGVLVFSLDSVYHLPLHSVLITNPYHTRKKEKKY